MDRYRIYLADVSPYLNENENKELKMGELFKTQHTIDEMLDRMGVKIVLDTDHLSEDDVLEAEKSGSSVVLKKKRSEKVE